MAKEEECCCCCCCEEENKEEKKTKKKEMKIIKQGKKINEKYCPHCEDQIMVKMKNGMTESFVCENCKFTIAERSKNNKENDP